MIRTTKTIFATGITALLIFTSALMNSHSASAQGTVNITLTGIPPVLPSPSLSDLVTGYETGQYTMQVLYSSPNQIPADFRLKVTLNHNGMPIAETLSEQMSFTPGVYFYNRFTDMPEIFFAESLSNLIQRLPSGFREATNRGVLPEGLYQLNLELLPVQPNSGIIVIPGHTFFTVQYAQPPVLFSPANNALLAQPQPIFSWTPVAAPPQVRVEYELIIAEIIGNQTPLQAIEGASYPVVRTTLTDQTIFLYTNEFLPLEPGKIYAWQVTSRDESGTYPFVNNGGSQIHVFEYQEPGGRREHFRLLTELIVEPGFARLTNFQRVRFIEDGFSYKMNGPGTLELNLNGQSYEIPVQLNDLAIQKTGLENAILMGGQFSGQASEISTMFGMTDILNADRLVWQFGTGFTTSANLMLPDGRSAAMSGNLSLSSIGLSGEIQTAHSPVMDLSQSGQGIIVREVSARFPGAILKAHGEAVLFDGEFSCGADPVIMHDDRVSAHLNCDAEHRELQLSGSDKGIHLQANHLRGYIESDYQGRLLSTDMTLDGLLTIDAMDPTVCSMNVELAIGNHSAELVRSVPSCISNASFNLGFGEVGLHQLKLNAMSRTNGESWQIEMEASADIRLPFNPSPFANSGNDLRLPAIERIILNEEGIHIPQIHFDESILESVPRFGLDDFRVKVRDFRLPELHFLWQEASQILDEMPGRGKPDVPGSWEFEMEGDLEWSTEQLPDGPLAGPECMRDARLKLSDGRFSNGRFEGAIDAIAGGDGVCTIQLTPDEPGADGIALEIRSLGGDVTGSVSPDGFSSRVYLRSDSRFTGAPYFTCSDGRAIAEGSLDVSASGHLSGSVTVNGSGGCDLPLGPYHATLTEGTITLNNKPDKTDITLSTGISVRYSGDTEETGVSSNNRTVEGTFSADLMKPEILELDVTLQGPVAYNIPEVNPVLQFVLNEAHLTREGLRIAGKHNLKTDEIQIEAEFEDVFISFNDSRITSGRVIIPDGFTLLVDVTDNPDIRFRIRAYDSTPADVQFAALMLEGPVVIDHNGISLNGAAHGAIRLGHTDLPDLGVVFRDNFRLQTDPFMVAEGRADLILDGSRIAWLDRDGLHADPTFFQHIAPERILLPVERVAYITLKDEDDWLLNLEPQDNGMIRVSTLTGKNPKLAVPALQGTDPEPPSYDFILEDVLVDPMSMSVVEGTITALVSDIQGISLESLGIPLQLHKIIFGDVDHGGFPVRGLYLEGDLRLFDTVQQTTEPARLMIMADGTVEGHVTLEGSDASFDMEQNGYVRFAVETISGHIRVPGGVAELAIWDLFVQGEFEVAFDGQTSASAKTSIRVQPGHVTVNAIAEGSHSGSSTREMEGFFIRVDRINTLSMSYSTLDGFDFYSNTDLTFGFRTKDETFTVPVAGVAIHPEGFSIPEQERHQHSVPPLNLPAFEVDGIRMRPIATRIPAVEVTWANLDAADIPGFLPRFDFEIKFPGFRDRAPQLAEATMTLADAGLTDGILSGSLLPYTFSGDGIPVPLANPASNPPVLYVKTIGGGIRRIETDSGADQKYEFTFAGKLRNLPSFRYPEEQDNGSGNDGSGLSPSDDPSDPGSPGQPGDPGDPGSGFETCVEPDLTIGYVPPMGFEAVISDIKPCGRLQLGPVGVEVDRSEIIFSYDGNTRSQSLHLEGDVSIYLPHPQVEDRDTRIAGSLGLDLMEGTIREGSVEITEQFRWYLPDDRQKVFVFGVNRARLDMEGLTLQGEASLLVQNDPLSVQFEEFRYDFETERFRSGRARIGSRVGIEIELSDRLESRLVDPESPFTATNAIRLTSEGAVTLDHEGLKLIGTSTAAFRLGDNDYPELNVVYRDENGVPFTLQPVFESIPPMKVTRGRADLIYDDSRIAWYDKDGIHFDNVLAALPIPDRIGLPTEDIAYLQLRDEQGELLVETENTGSGYILRTKAEMQVELVLNGFDEQNPPRARVGFEVEVNDAFHITGGRIEADLGNTPTDMQPFSGIPVRLISLKYEMKEEVYRLMADARLVLPGELEELELVVHELRFGPRGFEQMDAEIGRCTEQYDDSLPALASRSFGSGDTETFHVTGVKLLLGETNGVCISGNLNSTFLNRPDSDEPQPLFYRALWEMGQQEGRWATRLGFSEDQEIPVGEATIRLSEIEGILNQDGFNVIMSGQFSMADLMGSSFRVSVDSLAVGTNGVGVARASVEGEQQFDLFKGIMEGRITRFELEIDQNRVLYVSGDGWLKLFDHPMDFTNLRVGSDGSFSIDQADLLPGDTRLVLIENTAWLDTLRLSVIDKRLAVRAGGSVALPDPINATGSLTLGISIGENDSTIIDGPNIGLVFGSPGSEYTLGESSLTEAEIGSLATLAATGMAFNLDLYDISYSTFYASAILFMENDNGKRINFGDSGEIREKPGIKIRREQDPEWNVSSEGSNLFSFDSGFFRFQVNGVRTFNPKVFGIEIDGETGIVIEGDDTLFKGRTGFTGLQIAMPEDPENDPNPIRRWPDFAGLSVTIMDIIALELGVFDFGIAETESGIPFTVQKGDDPDNITEETIYVKEYLRFYNPLEGTSAVSISLTEAFSGGVEEILIYRDIHNTFLLHIKNANLSLASIGSLNINFRMLIGEGQLSLMAAGGGNLTGLGGLAAAGKFGIVDQGAGQLPLLSFGVFFAIRSETPIPFIPPAPPAIGLVGIGGGFFFRPEAVDLEAVYSAVGAMDEDLEFMLEKRGLPPTDANFAAMLYARFAMVGQGPINAYEGALFMELTDNYVNMIAVGSLVKQTGRITAGMTATLNWSNLSLSGRLAAKIDYDPALYGEGDLGFTLAINVPQSRIDWVVDGGLQANVLGIPANGSLVVSPAGLYAELGLNANYSLLVVSLDGNFTARTWVIPDYSNPLNSELGAFAQVDFKVDLFLASVNAVANGTFVIKNQGYSLYMLAELSVDIIGTEGAGTWAFAEIRNNRIVDAGVLYEIDEKLASLIDEAGNMADEMNEKANEAKNAVDDANQIFDTKLSDEILADAGANYFELRQTGFGTVLALLIDTGVMSFESYLYTPDNNTSVPAAFQWVNTQIRGGTRAPDRSDVLVAENNMKNRLADANSTGSSVIETINNSRAQAVKWVEESLLDFGNLESPLTLARQTYQSSYDGITISSEVPFGVNSDKAGALSGSVSDAAEVKDTFSERVPDYLEMIEAAGNNLASLNAILNGTESGHGVIEQGRRYSIARQAIGEYYSRRASHFHELYRWADTKHSLLLTQELTIKDAVNNTIQAYVSMNNSTAQNRCIDLYDRMSQYNTPTCTSRYGLGQMVALKRREAIMVLNGASTTQVISSVNELNTVMNRLISDQNYSEFNNRYRQTGNEYWYEMLDLGLQSFKSEANQKAIETNNARISTLSVLETPHRTFTQSLDSLYILKARMTENLYAMIDAFLFEYERAGLTMNESFIAELMNKRNHYALSLVPATLSSLSVTSKLLQENNGRSYRDRFLNEAVLNWSGSHPVSVNEFSVGIRSGLSTNVASSRLLSAGRLTRYNHWTHKGYTESTISRISDFSSGLTGSFSSLTTIDSSPNPVLDFTATVRARGEAGYTSSRSLQFQVRVEGNDNWTLLAGHATTTNAPAGTSIPEKPSIKLHGGRATRITGTIPEYWWHHSGQLAMTLGSSDSQTGIQRFEMAIGSSPDIQDIYPWTTVSGTRETTGSSVNLHAVIRHLELVQGGAGNHIQIRAINGAGHISTVNSILIYVDETPPVRVAAAPVSTFSRALLYDSNTLSTTSTITRTGTFTIVQNPEYHTITLPSFSDPESGIIQVEYIESAEARLPLAGFEAGYYQIADSSVIEAPVSFRDSSYVYVRALNGAGLYSDIVVISYKTTDLTSPTRPTVKFNPVLNGLKITFETRSNDPETGIKGIQFALGSGPGLADIKPWPEQNAIDFAQPVLQEASATEASTTSLMTFDRSSIENIYPYYLLPNDNLPMDRTFYVSIRALNGQNLRSGSVVSGPLIISRKPPEIDTVSISALNGILNMYGSVKDPVGVTKVSYRVRDNVNGDFLGEGHLFGPVLYSSSLETVEQTATLSIPGSEWRHSVKVLISAENAAGLIRNLGQEIVINPNALNQVPGPSNVIVSSGTHPLQNTISWDASPSPYIRRYEIILEEGNEIKVIGETDAGTRSYTYTPVSSRLSVRYGVRAVSMTESLSPVIFSGSSTTAQITNLR